MVLDGFIATAAALVAAELCPTLRGYLIAAHRSVEPRHRVACERLGARLLAVLPETATFAEVGVSGPAESGVGDADDMARRAPGAAEAGRLSEKLLVPGYRAARSASTP